MPHYKDGTPAKEGDRVVGVGYNEKNGDGSPRVISGTIIHVNQGESCNVQVVHTKVQKLPEDWIHPSLSYKSGYVDWCAAEGRAFFSTFDSETGKVQWWRTHTLVEYGQADHFVPTPQPTPQAVPLVEARVGGISAA